VIKIDLLEDPKEKLTDVLIEEYNKSKKERSTCLLTNSLGKFTISSSGDIEIIGRRELTDIERLRSFLTEEAARTSRTTKLQDFLYSFLPRSIRDKKIDRYMRSIWTPLKGSYEKEVYPLRLKTGRRTRLYRVSISREPDHSDFNDVIEIGPIGAMGGFYSACDVASVIRPAGKENLSYPMHFYINSRCRQFTPSVMKLILNDC